VKALDQRNIRQHLFETLPSAKMLSILWNAIKSPKSLFFQPYIKSPMILDLSKTDMNEEQQQKHFEEQEIQTKKQILVCKDRITFIIKNEQLFNSDAPSLETFKEAKESVSQGKHERHQKKKKKSNFNVLDNNKIMKEGFSQLVDFQEVTAMNTRIECIKELIQIYKETGGDCSIYRDDVKKLLDQSFIDLDAQRPQKRKRPSEEDIIQGNTQEFAEEISSDDSSNPDSE
jgi:hypothetical protein